MNISELTAELIEELKLFFEIDNETGKIYDKRRKKYKEGNRFSFKFPSCGKSIQCDHHDIIWVFNNGPIPYGYKVNNQLELQKVKTGRPRGSKDSAKRTDRIVVNTRKEMDYINNLFETGASCAEISKKTGLSRNQLINLKRKPDISQKDLTRINLEDIGDITGIYCIGAYIPNDRPMWYIGSSNNIKKRLTSHFNDLNNNRHTNKKMQSVYNKHAKYFRCYIMELCPEDELLHKESKLITKYCRGCLFNEWVTDVESLLPYYQRAANISFREDRYTVIDECWVWNTEHRGYGSNINVCINGQTKSIRPHRLSYFIKHGQVPQLVRHLCNNKRCVNPDHLIDGSHKQNRDDYYNSDEYIDWLNTKEKDFTQLWIKYDSHAPSIVANSDYSIHQCYYYQKKFKLKEKYPNVKHSIPPARKPRSNRGPEREIVQGRTIGCWLCTEEWVKQNSHKWECINCGKKRQTSKQAINKYPACKKCEWLAERDKIRAEVKQQLLNIGS